MAVGPVPWTSRSLLKRTTQRGLEHAEPWKPSASHRRTSRTSVYGPVSSLSFEADFEYLLATCCSERRDRYLHQIREPPLPHLTLYPPALARFLVLLSLIERGVLGNRVGER